MISTPIKMIGPIDLALYIFTVNMIYCKYNNISSGIFIKNAAKSNIEFLVLVIKTNLIVIHSKLKVIDTIPCLTCIRSQCLCFAIENLPKGINASFWH